MAVDELGKSVYQSPAYFNPSERLQLSCIPDEAEYEVRYSMVTGSTSNSPAPHAAFTLALHTRTHPVRR